MLTEIISSQHCNPILVRLGWHDSGTYDASAGEWPKAGGATGSIRFSPEKDHGANKGLDWALDALEPVKKKYPQVTYADLFQLASATAVELGGGPKIPMRYGRVDVSSPEDCAPDGNLPAAAAPFPKGCATPQEHLKDVFYRMGFNDQEIVALSGAHTLGRAKLERSGAPGVKAMTKYTKNGPGNPGGSSWTREWLKFDNSYFKDVKEASDEDLLILPTDACIFEDEGFKPWAELYANDQDKFFEDYAAAHCKLSEIGAKFEPEGGITLD